MKLFIRKYRVEFNKEKGIHEESASGHAVAVEYDNDGITERVIHTETTLNLVKKIYRMTFVTERQSSSGDWFFTSTKTSEANSNKYMYLNGVSDPAPFEEVDDLDNEKFKPVPDEFLENDLPENFEPESYIPKEYYKKMVLKQGLLKETEHLATTLGEPALFPYFEAITFSNNDIQLPQV